MSDVPPVALRTYTAIRGGVVAVILCLGVAVGDEIAHASGHCVQRSLSAYFYTPVRPVFVGALLVIGFSMIVMWGATVVEDNAFNLAGLLLVVAALVPTLDANSCSLPRSVVGPGASAPTTRVADDVLVRANAETVARSFTALLVVLWVVLVVLAVASVVLYRHAEPGRRPSRNATIAYVVTWALSFLALVVYTVLYQDADDPDSAFNHHVHGWSANTAFGLIIVAVVAAAVEKRGHRDRWSRRWASFYGSVAAAMVATAVVIRGGDHLGLLPGWVHAHATFVLEAVLITLIGVFWSLQTIDRAGRGAPRY